MVRRVQDALWETAEPFGPRAPAPPVLRWGLLYAALGGRDERDVAALELVYEGYLLHYRESRVIGPSRLETGLLAGDVFYARGLRRVAARGDVSAVSLLTRLMSTCSYLRSVEAPYAADDALWASATGGLAALSQGRGLLEVSGLFDDVDAELVRGAAIDVAAMALAASPRLGLPWPEALVKELERSSGEAQVAAFDASDDRR